MKIMAAMLAAGMLVSATLAISAQSQQSEEADAVRHLIMQTFDNIDAPLTVEPVTVLADIAVAGWAQGDIGGRALLRKKDGSWRVDLCSGDALKDPAALQQFGLTSQQARTLASAVTAAEKKLDSALVAKFSRFDGVVTMGSGQHPTRREGGLPRH